MSADSLSLGSSFRSFFEVVPALTPSLEREAYRIRHEVYCSDLSYENRREDGLETDEYDRHSLHCLLRSVKTGMYVGCSRLIFARPENPNYLFPFEKTCAGALDRAAVAPYDSCRHRIVEVSRLAVIKEFRRRKGEHDKHQAHTDAVEVYGAQSADRVGGNQSSERPAKGGGQSREFSDDHEEPQEDTKIIGKRRVSLPPRR